MKTVLIHQAFVSPNDAGGTRHYELAKRLVDAGQQFTIVASDLNYLTGNKVRRDEADEVYDGVKVLRAWTYSSLHTSFGWRVVSFISFMITAVWKSWAVKDVDLVMGTSPPIFQALSAWVISVMTWRPFLLEIRDLWPAFAIEMGVLRNPVLIWLARRVESFLYSRANHLIVNSPAYRDYLIQLGIAADKISVIPNGVDVGMFAVEEPKEDLRVQYGLQDKFVVTYTGAMGMANNLEVVLHAASLLRDLPDIHFLLVGDGKDRLKLQSLAAELNLANVTFIGAIPKSQIPNVLAQSDTCLAVLRDIPMFRTTYPNKVFDYMAAGRPVVLAIDGVIRDVVEAAEGGIPIPPGNPEAMVGAIRLLHADRRRGRQMGLSGRAYVSRHFDRNQQAVEFDALIRQVASKAA